jgi:RNA polymerase sigma-70 factor (ECF subfamily)
MSADNFKDALVAEIPNLRAFAASLSGSVTLADDLVQDALLRAWSNSDKFQAGTNLRAWLFTILRNAYYSHYRKRAREVQDTDSVYSGRIAVAGDQESHLDLADFRKALAKLPAEQREALTMIGATGLSYEEAAEICGVAIGTIKSRLNRARTKLAELLSAEGADAASLDPPPLVAPTERRSSGQDHRECRGRSAI